jgi:hypothetical protein
MGSQRSAEAGMVDVGSFCFKLDMYQAGQRRQALLFAHKLSSHSISGSEGLKRINMPAFRANVSAFLCIIQSPASGRANNSLLRLISKLKFAYSQPT